jgi:hypothetical protein
VQTVDSKHMATTLLSSPDFHSEDFDCVIVNLKLRKSGEVLELLRTKSLGAVPQTVVLVKKTGIYSVCTML